MRESFKHADQRKVVARDTAENIGTVKGFIVDPTASRVEAIHVEGRGKKAGIVRWESITAFGPDAVMADTAGAVAPVETDHQQQAVKGKITASGSRVLTTSGFAAGTVEDVEFDTDTGWLVAVVTQEGVIDAPRLRSLGSYALVVDPQPG